MNPGKGICGVTDSEADGAPVLRDERVRYHATPHGFVLYDAATDSIFDGNRTALEIIRLLDGNHTDGEVAARLARKFSVALGVARRDTHQFVERLRRLGLLKPR